MNNILNQSPKKFLSQNYLIDENIAANIVKSFKIKKNDFILEIGSGKGALTKYILEYTKNLIAVEIDNHNYTFLKQNFPEIIIINNDFLKISLSDIYEKYNNKIRVIGNIPYKITSPILFKLIENRDYIKDAQLMVQEEVAQRIIAKPNSKKYGIPSVLINTFAETEQKFKVSKNCFYPKPNVESRIIYLDFSCSQASKIKDIIFFIKLVKKAFNTRRKKLKNSLKQLDADLSKTSIDLNRRAENLTIEEFIIISNELC